MRNHFMRPSLKEKLKTLPKWSGEGEMTMLFAINCLVVLSEDSELSEEFLKAADVYIKRVAEGQNLSAMPSWKRMLQVVMWIWVKWQTS